MAASAFDITTLDAQAMPAMPVAPADFDSRALRGARGGGRRTVCRVHAPARGHRGLAARARGRCVPRRLPRHGGVAALAARRPDESAGLSHRRGELPGAVVRHRRDRGGVRRRIRMAGGTGARGATAVPDRPRGVRPGRPSGRAGTDHAPRAGDDRLFPGGNPRPDPAVVVGPAEPAERGHGARGHDRLLHGLRRSAGGGPPDTCSAHRRSHPVHPGAEQAHRRSSSCGPATASPARGPARGSG